MCERTSSKWPGQPVFGALWSQKKVSRTLVADLHAANFVLGTGQQSWWHDLLTDFQQVTWATGLWSQKKASRTLVADCMNILIERASKLSDFLDLRLGWTVQVRFPHTPRGPTTQVTMRFRYLKEPWRRQCRWSRFFPFDFFKGSLLLERFFLDQPKWKFSSTSFLELNLKVKF